MAQKSLLVTYLLWLFGGVFGLHHFYLNRDFHALTWWMFLGGYFGIGLIRDLWRIPEYVKDANQDIFYMQELKEKMRKHEKPPISSVRYFGMVTVADAFATLIINAIPTDFISGSAYTLLHIILMPGAVSLGIALIGNIGRHEGKLSDAAFGAYLMAPIYLIFDAPQFLTVFYSSYSFNRKRKWRLAPRPQKPLASRLAFLFCCALIFFSLWGSWFYFNCTVESSDGQKPVKCRDAAKHFFTSPIWNEFLNVIKEVWRVVLKQDFQEAWKQFMWALDPIGETNALRVLGLTAGSTQQQISARYRKLSREWHPDKHKPEKKNMAADKFIEIQQAYEILSKIKSQRMTQNNKLTTVTEDL
ncbi:hypothetical protein JTE90_016828 [Oedothorax gibbosus]|uniref:DnaJ homolog subfamily C member 22 n=1 Tax=Oedothorax gibbosus TaxID=931172 RepID=A0AAV6VZ08_9ARAC|nr:hypothetical protein JTE90_016828 [Oedothorax gibbosus]